ncbi:MAG TPA: alanine--tRNA ligase, partial [Ruminococcaceae bacterium]|nr:alanine--tRNA ligase [Oscillospiraceae bacterium]
MEWTGLNELREKYLSFFESKGHLRLPSFSLIPQNDKSLLLINSGMAPMKKWFTGEETPPRKRVTTCQKCIRTPDIENVGKTARHGTYFEMLGNFSFGDYFKHEVIPWAWEFCTKVMEMDPEKLYISVYEDDDEAYDIWTKDIGVDPSHMVRFGKEDNFWEHGAGPCGPCSEIYYDRGEKYGCGKPGCKVGCECDRYIEFWNLVFTQFENDGNNNYSRLAHPNIDTGMGLERLACISQDVDNLFEVDTVQNIMKHIMKIAGVKYHDDEKKDISLRVITDHVRSTTMMISDGVMPSNEGRGYVLRRLLRRAARHGRLLGIDRPFLYEVAETVIKENDTAYPNLLEKHDFIINVIKAEEENFAKTIDTGLNMLEEMVKNTDGKVMSGTDAFKLSDTYGFPLDLTKDILEEKGMTVDEQEYLSLMTEARKKAREAHKDAGAETWKSSGNATKGMEKTPFTGYETLSGDSEILAVVVDGEKRQAATEDDNITLVLSETPFYAESGGQVGDVGVIRGNGFEFTVENTTKTHEGVILHHGYISDGETVSCGDKVHAEVDRSVREATMRNHTAAHLLQAALRGTLGTHVEQAGQLVNSEAVRFDFTHFSALTSEELKDVENKVNSVIMAAMPVVTKEMPIDEAKKLGAMALFGEKYGDIVRVVTVGDFSVEFCGGTHVKNTGSIGLFKIVSESSVASGVRRIEAVTGTNVMKYIDKNNELIAETVKNLKLTNYHELASRAAALSAELKEKEREIASLEAEIAASKTADLMKDAKQIGDVRLVTADIGEAGADALRSLCDKALENGDDIIAVFAGKNAEKGTASFACRVGKKAIECGAHAGNIVREVARVAGGAGGGKPDSAMAGAKDVSKIPEAL